VESWYCILANIVRESYLLGGEGTKLGLYCACIGFVEGRTWRSSLRIYRVTAVPLHNLLLKGFSS
jgi:hypothetical protein